MKKEGKKYLQQNIEFEKLKKQLTIENKIMLLIIMRNMIKKQ